MMKTPYGNRGDRLSRENKTTLRQRGGRRKFAWVFGATTAVCALLYWEQTELLYVLSTLAMCGLLLVVAFSDLEGRDKELNKTDLANDVAAADSGMTPKAFSPASAGASQANEQTMKRRKVS
jgi:hypothetical protein